MGANKKVEELARAGLHTNCAIMARRVTRVGYPGDPLDESGVTFRELRLRFFLNIPRSPLAGSDGDGTHNTHSTRDKPNHKGGSTTPSVHGKHGSSSIAHNAPPM